MSYYVWSQHVEPVPQRALELKRTDLKVAREDVSLIQSVLHRKAWIEEVDDATGKVVRVIDAGFERQRPIEHHQPDLRSVD